ncbi:MAG: metallophosphoesterase family protein [Acidimicrobiales bacterium]
MRASARRWVAPTVVFVAFVFSLFAPGSGAQEPTITFAALGDFGADSGNHTAVADMMDRWNPDFIITVGDNRYDVADYDPVIGRRYCDYLTGVEPGPNCSGGNSQTNRFFPALGNHDYNDGNGIGDYLDYFSLPGNERNYDYVRGPVHFFVVDSGRWGSIDPSQADWLRTGLQGSTSPWQIVYFHHSAYSSAQHGSNQNMQLDYAGWGADAVLSGHDHHYERIERDGIVYFVNGLGGRSIYGIAAPIPGSRVRYNADYGAMRITAGPSELTFEFRAVDGDDGQLIDSHTITNDGSPTTSTTLPTTTTPGGSGFVEVRVGAGGDDVEQILADSSLYADSSDIELVDDSSYKGQQIVGLRFRGVDVPPGATVTRAYLRFTADESDTSHTDLVIAGHDVGQTWAFTGSAAVSDRAATGATVRWDGVASWTQGRIYDSPDLRSIVQEIVDRGDWRSGNDLALMISGSGERTAESFNGSPVEAPLLRVEYSTDQTPPPTTTWPTTTVPPTPTTTRPTTTSSMPAGGGTIEVRVGARRDDVEEGIADSVLYTDSSDIELVDDSSYKGEQIVGLRFRGIDVPPGATVTRAYLRFTADESDSVATDLSIHGHDVGDAPPFGPGVNGVGARPPTGATARWQAVDPWIRGRTYDSPDLHPVIQEIVDRGDWESGGDIALIISGTGERTAESFDGQPNAAPLLHIEFADGTPGPTTTTTGPTTTTTTTTAPTTTTTTATGPTTTAPTTSTTTPPGGVPAVLDVRVARGADDVEETSGDGVLYTDSSDIELVDDSFYKGHQLVGLRFTAVDIPVGATITRATLRFTADESDSVATNLTVAGHDIGDAQAFGGPGAVSSRSRTSASVAWLGIEPWSRGGGYESPDLRSIVQEIVDRGDWRSGNAMALIVTGSGERTAESYEGWPARAPLLHIEYVGEFAGP